MNPARPEEFHVRQEEDDLGTRRITITAVGSVLVALVAIAVAGAMLVAEIGSLRPDEAAPGGPRPVPRTLSGIEQTPIDATEVGLDRRADQRRELERWGWADRDAGLARIPIDRAIDVFVAESSQ